MTTPLVHRMKLSIPGGARTGTRWGRGKRNSWLAVWCTCMAQTNDQLGHPGKAGDTAAEVPWRFWAFDYIAVIPITQPAGPVFRQHVLEADAREATAA